MFAHSKTLNTLINTFIVFLLAVSYYSYTSKSLPIGAGPDSAANYDAVKFYYKQKRLAIFPDDQDNVTYSPYGTTRLVRPPFSFMVSALLVHASPFNERATKIAFRAGSVFLCALAVALTFLALRWYFNSNWYASLGSVLIGLLPQFAFIGSHVNDDSGGIFSATLLLSAFIYIYRRGVSLLSIAFLATSIGLILVSKFTAWLLLPSAMIFVLSFVRFRKEDSIKYITVTLACIVIAGGWWVLYNTYHYGIDDPTALKINQKIANDHRTLPASQGQGFSSKGVGFYQLIINNHKDFIGASFISTIGNLDWLRLKVGPLQYGLYLVVVIIAAIYFLTRSIAFGFRLVTGSLKGFDNREFAFEAILFFAIVFQIFMFIWRNVYQDIQIQGKYMLPVFLAVLILFLSAIRNVVDTTLRQLENHSLESFWITGRNLFKFGAVLSILFIVYIHLNGLFAYVIPYYSPPLYRLNTGQLNNLNLSRGNWTNTSKGITIDIVDDNWLITSYGADPYLVLPDNACNKLDKHIVLQVSFYAEKGGNFQAFIDDGSGFKQDNSDRIAYSAGKNSIILGLSAEHCEAIRLDPMNHAGRMTINAIALSDLVIRKSR